MSEKKKTLNFLLCIDRNFILATGALIASILANHKDEDVKFHVFTSSSYLDEASNILLSRLTKKFDCKDDIIFKSYDEIPLYKKLEGKVNTRILVQCMRIIAVNCCDVINSDRLIYLDADIICVGNISALNDFDFKDNLFAVTKSEGPKEIITDTKDKFKVKDYFCSGVMVFNLKNWRESNLEKELIDFVVKYKPILPDQDALNIVCVGKYLEIGSKYQKFTSFYNKKDTLIIHYAGSDKPWTPWNFHKRIECVNIFRHYCKMFEPDVTQWISFKQDKDTLVNFNWFHARKAMKWLSKLFLKRGNYKAFIYFYWRHLQIKIKQKGIIGILLMKSNTRS